MKTYIIKTKSGEFYCGKTNNINRRLKEHLKEKRPHWFGFKNRKDFDTIIVFKGDFEKKFKKFGSKNLYQLITNFDSYWFYNIKDKIVLPLTL